MSFNLRNIREISNEPLSKFVSHLAYRVAKLTNDQQTQELENKEDIYSAGQDVDSVIKLHSLNSTKSFDFTTQYFPPTEPDDDKLRLWVRGNNMGNRLTDLSLREGNPEPHLIGDPILVDGAPHDDGIFTGGVKSLALRFNRPNTPNDEYVTIPFDNDTRVSEDLNEGISFFCRFRVFDLDEEGGENRCLFEGTDDVAQTQGVQIEFTDSGRLIYHQRKDGVDHSKQTAIGTITTDTVYDAWFIYDADTEDQFIYVNGTSQTLSGSGTPDFHEDTSSTDKTIFSIGAGTAAGNVYGDLYDFRIYREEIIEATQVTDMYTNKWTIADIPFGQVMVANYYATYIESTAGYDPVGYDSTGYDTV